jgi:Dolichyl-phosphate-mannose-protein mannosyltransferase
MALPGAGQSCLMKPSTTQDSGAWLHLGSFKDLRIRFRKCDRTLVIGLAAVIACCGLASRLVLLLLAGNREVGQLSGVGDQIRYISLADSIFHGRGFTYEGLPTALRPPAYPLLLAGLHVVCGDHYLFAMRILQLFAGVAVAYVCLVLATNLFGAEAGAMAGATALIFPTLVFISTELQTEAFTTLLVILFLFLVLQELSERSNGAVGIGVLSGLASVLRFNCAILPLAGAVACWWPRRRLKNALTVCVVSGLIIAPWIIRNTEVFHGKVLFSSHGGINLLEGVLTPDGRAQQGDSERLRAAVGWLHTDIEVNDAHRLSFPSEEVLDAQARRAAIEAWSNLGWEGGARLLAKKIVTFWLSTDQLLDTSNFSPRVRVLRATGVVAYWIALALALVGLIKLFSTRRVAAITTLAYALFVTAAHLPFVMNTRLRIPFVDPLVAVLAAGGLLACVSRYGGKADRLASHGASPAHFE